MSQFDREEQQLSDDYNAGLITREEYNRRMRELQRDYRDAAAEAAEQAYDREMSNW